MHTLFLTGFNEVLKVKNVRKKRLTEEDFYKNMRVKKDIKNEKK